MSYEFHPFAEVFPMIEGEDFKNLIEDIRKNGLIHPITLLEGKILDGRNRYKACLRAGVQPSFDSYDGDNPSTWVWSQNANRRHLQDGTKAVLWLKMEKADAEWQAVKRGIEEKARKARSVAGKAGNDARWHGIASGDKVSTCDSGKVHETREARAKQAGVSSSVMQKAETLSNRAPELMERVAKQEITLAKAEKLRKRKEREDEIASAASIPISVDRCDLRHGSCLDAMKIKKGTVDMIITDPPYPAEYLDVFDDLGNVGFYVLKEGGLALIMIGQSYLPEILSRLGKHLQYHWTMAYLTPGGQAVQQFQRKVNVFWKPILIFSKGKYSGEWFGDVAKSNPNDNDKDHHYWGQSVSGMRDLMKRFVHPNDVILDPFLGGGTTALVSLELGATFIGFDVDPKAISTTRGRLSKDYANMV